MNTKEESERITKELILIMKVESKIKSKSYLTDEEEKELKKVAEHAPRAAPLDYGLYLFFVKWDGDPEEPFKYFDYARNNGNSIIQECLIKFYSSLNPELFYIEIKLCKEKIMEEERSGLIC